MHHELRADGGNNHPFGGVELTHDVTAHCPRCDRKESIKGELEAKAWLYQHIAVEHADELPNFENSHE